MIKKIFAMMLIGTFPQFSFAITREAAVQYALENSEAVRMVMESAAALRAEGEQITAFTNIQLNLNAAHFELGDNKAENPFMPSPDRDISAEAQISKLIFAGGRIWKSRDLAGNFNKQADIAEQSGKRDIKKQVQAAFDAVLYQQAVLDILKDRLEQRQNELEDAQDLKDAGMVTSLDVRQAKLSLNVSQDQLEEGQAAYREALISFNLAMGRSGEEELLIPEGNLSDVPNLQAMLNLLKTSLSENDLLDLKSAATQADAARLNYEMAKGEVLPEVALVASGKSSGEALDEMNESWTVGVHAQWDFLDGGLIQGKTASAKAEMQKAKENLTRTQKSLAGDIEILDVNIRSLEDRIRLQQETVELSQKNYEDARGHYRAGTITLTRLGEFNLSYAEARFNLLRLFFLQRQQWIRAEAMKN
jgi:outer membrane protein TolC